MPLILFIPPENIRKLEVFWCFQGVQKETCSIKWTKLNWTHVWKSITLQWNQNPMIIKSYLSNLFCYLLFIHIHYIQISDFLKTSSNFLISLIEVRFRDLQQTWYAFMIDIAVLTGIRSNWKSGNSQKMQSVSLQKYQWKV